jgi:hypothetical protein
MIHWLMIAITTLLVAPARAQDRISYNQHIRPILSDNCFYCHGPDKNHRDGKFRLDERDAALKGGRSKNPAIVPGKPQDSELIKRIETADEDDVMPPPKTHKTLTAAQKDLLRQWIAQGAEYEPHWAYIVPKRPAVPAVKDARWMKNPIDAFILAALEKRGLAPSPEADRATLLRRLSFDLIGLPPTPKEVAAFVADKSPDAYEKQVDRLLASPHYGERMAVPWLDAVRFSDTVGFHGDQNQNVFPYRDYVIDSFNANKPFDQFTIEQIAGDLLPNPTIEQRVATCFNRLNMMTREGGAQPKEYMAKYAADRVRTVSNAWLGSTMGCCECHNHKFDPFTTKDFYSMGAFWADLKQWGVYTTYSYTPNPDLPGFTNDHPFPPEIVVSSPYLKRRIAKLESRLDEIAKTAKIDEPKLAAWRERTSAYLKENPFGWVTPAIRGLATSPATKTQVAGNNGSVIFLPGKVVDERLELEVNAGTQVAAIRLEALPSEKSGGKIVRGNLESSTVQPTFLIKGQDGKETKLGVFFADADAKDDRYANGYAILGIEPVWKTASAHPKSAQSAVYLLDKPMVIGEGQTLVVSLPKNTLASARVSVSPVAGVKPIDSAIVGELRSGDEAIARRTYVLSSAADSAALAECRKIQREIYECRDGKSPVLTTQTIPTPTTQRVLPRGNWQDESGEIVRPATPAFLTHSAPADGRRLTRVDLAKWLVSPENPLTSHAVTNRLWKQLFGAGISGQVEDLGAQGEWPSHPELLDWLAVEFQGSGWDLKHMVRLMVMSTVYRQSSALRPELRDIDPANRLLASQNPRRLEAEFVRDNALAIAGLLEDEIGGPSCFPYQPAGYYANIQFPDRAYVANSDERQYRRGVYMHWQRTFLHPMLANFDAPSREDAVCTRNVSNTPQQALTLLNDPTFVEAARVLAQKLVCGCATDEEVLSSLFERALAREPRENESASLSAFLAGQRKYYKDNPAEAQKLLPIGNTPVTGDGGPIEIAAWTNVCRVVLNLHETITRY